MPEDILNSIDDEPKTDIPDEGEEGKSEDILSEIADDEPKDDLPDPRETDPKKNSEALIRAELRKVAAGDKDLEDVPEWCRPEVKRQFDEIKAVQQEEKFKKVEELSSEVSSIKEELAEKKKREDRDNASEVLNKYLESGIDRDEFEKEHRKFFTETVRGELKNGSTWTKAVKLAIGELVSHGVVPDVTYALEARRAQGGKFYGGGDTPRPSTRELDEINSELAKSGVKPASKEALEKVKNMEF